MWVALEVIHTELYVLLFEMWFVFNLLQKSFSFHCILELLCESFAGSTLAFQGLGPQAFLATCFHSSFFCIHLKHKKRQYSKCFGLQRQLFYMVKPNKFASGQQASMSSISVLIVNIHCIFLNTLHVLIHFILHNNPVNWYYCHLIYK